MAITRLLRDLRPCCPRPAAMMGRVPHPAARQPRRDALRNRERVLDAATELVRRDGEKVPIAQIAEHAGVGVGTVYRHFPTREDLLGALVHRSFGLAVDNARAAAAHPGSALDGVRAFFLATLRDRERFVLPLARRAARSSPLPRASARRRSHRAARTDRAWAGRRRTARRPDVPRT